jgi:NAD(P)H-nitrite reductase large subunit
VKQGVRIVEARGKSDLTAVVAARTDPRRHILPGTERIYHTDTLAVGYGFSPNIELPQQAGCAVSYAADKGGWIVDVDPAMATSVPGIYAAGETTGIAGAGKSFIEGQIAAWDILFKTGRVDRRFHDRHVRPLARRRQHQVRYGRFLNRLCRPAPACYADIPDETIICRCEEITMGEIRRQLTQGFSTLNGIKRATRCTMGNCQGRTCGPILADIIGALTHLPPEAAGCPSARAPVKTVALGALAKM